MLLVTAVILSRMVVAFLTAGFPPSSRRISENFDPDSVVLSTATRANAMRWRGDAQ
jgi:hypothetical protein